MNLASRKFELPDQEFFAKISGDHNPMHVDALLARRTMAGGLVVHGIHLLLWSLDALAASIPDLPRARRLRVRLHNFVYVGESVQAVLAQRKATEARVNVNVDGQTRSQVIVSFGDPLPAESAAIAAPTERIDSTCVPLNLDFEQMADRSGRLVFATPPESLAAVFPAASSWLGARRLAALAATTNLVGMICPGLHSVYRSLTVQTCAESDPQDVLDFRVTEIDRRFRLVHQELAGGGLVGTLESAARLPPMPQATMQSLAGLIGPTEFAGSVALIVGGSRGLGELTAKLIAGGGGRVIITYRVGSADARAVADEIRAAGGRCDTLAYDSHAPAEDQLACLEDAPTHAYYFATPTIFRAQSELFVSERLSDFLDVYVHGFWRLARALHARRHEVSIYYPSSVAVDERPSGMTEYAMAKAAGEALCTDMNKALEPMHVTTSRLPRLPTDQTATLTPVETASAVETMLPVVREVQSWPRTSKA
jgi:acyl dehydratase